MPIVGNVMLLLWPLIILIMFKKLRLQVAVIWAIVGGYLLLPSKLHWNFPLIPNLDKDSIPALATLVIGFFVLRKMAAQDKMRHRVTPQSTVPPPYTVLRGWVPRSFVGFVLLLLMVVGVFVTVSTNGDPLVFGPFVIPGLRSYDALSMVAGTAFMLTPLILGRKFLSDNDSHRTLVFILCIAGVIYALPALWEVRMSPRLNYQIYGFFPHSWIQHIRGDGFRPLVFLDHGLLLGVFFSCSTVAAAGCIRLSTNRRWLFLIALAWLAGTLLLSKTLAALVFAMIMTPFALLMPVRIQLLVAATIATVVLFYPILRGGDWIPTEEIIETAAEFDEDRANSLAFRFEQEDLLLERANERAVFGWGGWGRWRIYDERTGEDISVSDGAWLIVIGESGWVGYIAYFGLMTIPMIIFVLRRRRYDVGLATSIVALILSTNLIDMLPNSSTTPVLWLMVGAMLGRLELVRQQVAKPEPDTALSTKPRRRRARFRPQPVEDDGSQPVMAQTGSTYTRFATKKSRHSSS